MNTQQNKNTNNMVVGLVDSIMSKDYVKAKDQFTACIRQKTLDRLEQKKIHVAKNLYSSSSSSFE